MKSVYNMYILYTGYLSVMSHANSFDRPVPYGADYTQRSHSNYRWQRCHYHRYYAQWRQWQIDAMLATLDKLSIVVAGYSLPMLISSD